MSADDLIPDDETEPEGTDSEESAPLVLLEDEPPPAEGTLAAGRMVIKAAAKTASTGPGVYRMIDARDHVLYVGKAKNIQKRVLSYTRPTGLSARIIGMVAQTVRMEFISTKTETDALLLEANLIKQLKPRANVLLRDDKSFPYILITRDHAFPQISKHRGARARKGDYFGPFASAWAVERTINALERAFLLRSCTDAMFETRSRPCLLFQIKRCAGPCTGEIGDEAYKALVREATAFLSGRSRVIKDDLARQMEQASAAMEFEQAAVFRDRLSALATIQASQGINPRKVEEADVFAIHEEGGAFCVQVFFFRTAQNWGNRAYFPRADRTLTPGEVLEAFVAQFYADKPLPALVLLSHEGPEFSLLREALRARAERAIEVAVPQRGEKQELVAHAAQNAREALGRKLAESATQHKLLEGLRTLLELPAVPRRIEIYDNSHIQGAQPVGAMVVAGLEGFRKKDYRTFNLAGSAGDDFAMMREVMTRRFKRLILEGEKGDEEDGNTPDLLIIDGGKGQVDAVLAVMAEIGAPPVPVLGIAKGRDRDAGRETLLLNGKTFRLDPKDPVLYFLQRLRDEVHRFAIGSHRARRGKAMREGGLSEIPGIGPTRKKALLRHFGTLKMVEGASVEDLRTVPGINAATAQAIHDFFHPPG